MLLDERKWRAVTQQLVEGIAVPRIHWWAGCYPMLVPLFKLDTPKDRSIAGEAPPCLTRASGEPSPLANAARL